MVHFAITRCHSAITDLTEIPSSTRRVDRSGRTASAGRGEIVPYGPRSISTLKMPLAFARGSACPPGMGVMLATRESVTPQRSESRTVSRTVHADPAVYRATLRPSVSPGSRCAAPFTTMLAGMPTTETSTGLTFVGGPHRPMTHAPLVVSTLHDDAMATERRASACRSTHTRRRRGVNGCEATT